MIESDGEIVKGCVNIYFDWFIVLVNFKKGFFDFFLRFLEKYVRDIF